MKEIRVYTDSGMVFDLIADPRGDNAVLKTWLFATGAVEGVLMRDSGDDTWTTYTYDEYLNELNEMENA